MGRFVLRRVIQIIPLIIGITIVTFALANLVPGSPISGLELNPDIRPEDLARIRHSLGLDQPLYIRYFQWFSHVIRGDLGLSLVTYRPVSQLILQKLPNTLLLTGAALLISLLFSIPVGVLAATRRNSIFDHFTTVGAVGGIAVPTFWLGLMMIIFFAVKFRDWGYPALPSGGVHTLGKGGFLDLLQHLLMPAFVLAFVQTAAWTRYIRSQMIEVLRMDYVRTAESKGLRDLRVIYGHALRNAILPLVTLLALDIPNLFSGAVVIEQIFTWNGIGRLIYNSATQRDYTTVMGCVLMVAMLTVVANLLADIAYGILDPRIRYE